MNNEKYHKTMQASNKTLNQLPEPVPCQFNVYLRKFSFLSANLSRIRKVTEASDLRPAKIKSPVGFFILWMLVGPFPGSLESRSQNIRKRKNGGINICCLMALYI